MRDFEIIYGPVASFLEALDANQVCSDKWLALHVDKNLFLVTNLESLARVTAAAFLGTRIAIELLAVLTEKVSRIGRQRASGDVVGSSSRDYCLLL